MSNLNKFEEKINIEFKNKKLLELAFTHRSYLNEAKKSNQHNERIEFLGDAVLELASTEFLYKKFPEKKEGELTALRSALVNTFSLFQAAEKLGLNDYLLLSKGEKTSVKGRDHILANTFEALIGAIYLEFGFRKVQEFLDQNLFGYLDEIIQNNLHKDPKSYFQELAQEHKKVTPEYKLQDHIGPDHDKEFVMAVFLGDEKIAEGIGTSKQKAEIEAARNALKKMAWD
ncbi:ribonuclease III [Candidatus Campbellbacteria bacterium]|nr:MAG: ribonuclease III [Candidatus Campbellbacteria bacterium]